MPPSGLPASRYRGPVRGASRTPPGLPPSPPGGVSAGVEVLRLGRRANVVGFARREVDREGPGAGRSPWAELAPARPPGQRTAGIQPGRSSGPGGSAYVAPYEMAKLGTEGFGASARSSSRFSRAQARSSASVGTQQSSLSAWIKRLTRSESAPRYFAGAFDQR